MASSEIDGSNLPFELPESLHALVSRRFISAKETSSLVFSKTEVTTIPSSDTTFQLRYCPALAKKPSSSQPGSATEKRNITRDPFEDPSSELLVAAVPASGPLYNIVLNKFPVIPNHFILATKDFKPQTHLLEKNDLEAAFSCLKEWDTPSLENGVSNAKQKRLFAFFNSGEHSGASQPHRHLQFLPVEDMVNPEDKLSWEPLIDRKNEANIDDTPTLLNLPFTCYAVSLAPNPSANELHRLYLSLYTMAVTALSQHSESLSNDITWSSKVAKTHGEAVISYNLAMTRSKMMICPRRSESAWIPIDSASMNGSVEEGLVKLNGTILAGTLMVKTWAEWDALKSKPSILETVLKTIGVPNSAL